MAVVYPGLQVASLDLISSALRLIGALASGEQAPAPEATDALASLNQMVDSWKTERLMVYNTIRNVYPLTSGIQTYTLGGPTVTAVNLDTVRYAKVERAGIISLNNAAQPLELPLDVLTDVGWQAIPVKNIQSALPVRLWPDEGFPLRNLNYWPVPNTNVQTALYLWTELTQFPDLTTQFLFPPGYVKALRYNLAVDLAAEWPGDPERMPMVAKIAMESRAVIKARNIQPLEMSCEPMIVGGTKGGSYNWMTDTPISKTF